MRLFVALEIPAEVRENLAALLGELRKVEASPRWVRPENLHVTLKFIGEARQEKLEAICAALATVRSETSVRLEFHGLGFFPGEKRPRVLWAGMEASANLSLLAKDVDTALETTGIPREKREFAPHLTLARFKEDRASEKLQAAIRERAGRNFGGLRTDEFHLIESKLKAQGAEYSRVASFAFSPLEG
ncbi:MAG TPA: RNA 2',3'-cyclic phosphodiesterase [Candidatus Acidoferrum sp.]|nr:RNA 2',3'-cyclic phosphodiesterase [Candidatus Acidoferrum sp.]